MTARRAPLSIDAALARIAGHLPGGWSDMAAAVSRSESTVRAWGDPARREDIPMQAAIALDLAYRAAGGDGAPVFEAYACKLDAAASCYFAEEIALSRLAALSIRESGEAHAALVAASQPGAGPQLKASARREVEEAIATLHRAIPLLAGSATALAGATAASGPAAIDARPHDPP